MVVLVYHPPATEAPTEAASGLDGVDMVGCFSLFSGSHLPVNPFRTMPMGGLGHAAAECCTLELAGPRQ